MESENHLLEMAEDFKNRIEQKNVEINNLKKKLLQSRKDLMYSYVLVKDIDIMVQGGLENGVMMPEEFTDLCELARSKMSSLIEDYLLSDVGGLDDD